MEYEDLKKYYDRNIRNSGYLGRQHNIMIIIGNGFDIRVMAQYYNKRKISRKNSYLTTYEDFYRWLTDNNFLRPNIFLETMKKYQKSNKKNWSNFEALIPIILDSHTKQVEKINEDLDYLQVKFSYFLSRIISNDLVEDIGSLSQEGKLAFNSLSHLLGDLDKLNFEKLKFMSKTNHYDIFNIKLLNMNYTNLFDNYIYLDKRQFDPNPYKNIDTNFQFLPNPNNLYNKYNSNNWNNDTKWSCYINTDIIHPHGQESIPRSLLFGSNCERFKDNKNLDRFNKEYWARYDVKYSTLLKQTELYIIYGSSIGESDSWWWKKICESLKNGAELIVYSYKHEFSSLDFVSKYVKIADRKLVLSRIFVVDYNNVENLNFLSLKNF